MVYVVDDDASVRRSLERLIRASGFRSACFESARSFLGLDSWKRPACLILDVRLPDIDGLSLHEELSKRGRSLPVIFITGHGTVPLSVKAMKQGALDFLEKPFEARELVDAVTRAVARDSQDKKQESKKKKMRSLIDMLTPREKEVFRWVITGKPNKQIASALGTAEKTVKVHRGRLMHKLCVFSVADLVRLAESAGITPAA